MGKVASDKCHKWVFKEPTECEPNISNYWQSSFDAVRHKTHIFIYLFFTVYLEVCDSYFPSIWSIRFHYYRLDGTMLMIDDNLPIFGAIECSFLLNGLISLSQESRSVRIETVISLLLVLCYFFFLVCFFNYLRLFCSLFDQTIAVIQAGHGLLQLGSCKIVSFFFPPLLFIY